MREGSRRSTGLPSVYYYPFSVFWAHFLLWRSCPWSAPRPTDASSIPSVHSFRLSPFYSFLLIFLCFIFLLPLTFAATLPFIAPLLFSILLLLLYIFIFLLFLLLLLPTTTLILRIDGPSVEDKRSAPSIVERLATRARLRAHGVTKQKGEMKITKVVVRNIFLSLYNHFALTLFLLFFFFLLFLIIYSIIFLPDTLM